MPSDLGSALQRRVDRLAGSWVPVAVFLLLVAAGTAALVAASLPVGPDWLGAAGAVTVASAFGWALAARTGGRPVVFGTLALAIGLVAVLTDQPILRSGAAVLTAAEAAVLGVMATVPAKGYLAAAREAVVAVLLAAVGALAAVGFEPTIHVVRFEYAALVLALAGAFVVVWRLGAGLHGLGRRGVLVVVVGAVVLTATLLYAEALRRYGPVDLVDSLLDGVRWSRDRLGAFPRPIEAVLGVPAIVYGCHMRARRRQGWWVCAFGVAGTATTATSLANPAIELSEVVLSVGYGLVVGVLVGWLVIRLDRAVTGSGGGGRRRAQLPEPLRPEPARTAPLS